MDTPPAEATPSPQPPPPASGPPRRSLSLRQKLYLLSCLVFGVLCLGYLVLVPPTPAGFEKTAGAPEQPATSEPSLFAVPAAEPPRSPSPPPVATPPLYPPLVAPDPLSSPYAESFEIDPWGAVSPPAYSDWRRPSEPELDLPPPKDLGRRAVLAAPLATSEVAALASSPSEVDPTSPDRFLASLLGAARTSPGAGDLPAWPAPSSPPPPPAPASAVPVANAALPPLPPPAPGRHIPRGTVLRAVLLYPISFPSQLQAVALVTETVPDNQGGAALPKGTRLFGLPVAAPSASKRVLVAWSRALLPDGTTLAFPPLATRDDRLAEGVAARAKSPVWSALGKAALLGILSSAAQLAAPAPRTDRYLNPGNTAAEAVALEISQVGRELVAQSLHLEPYFSVPNGIPVNLLLADDLALP